MFRIFTSDVRNEVRAMLALTGPLVLTQVGQIAILTTDTIMIGRLGEAQLAAAALTSTIYFTFGIIIMGVTMATAPLASQAFGARKARQVRRVIRQGLWVALLLSVPGVVGLAFTEEILVWLGQEPALARLAQEYATWVSWTLPPMGLFMVLRNFAASVNRPGPALWVMLAGIPLNALFNYALIYGELGMPRLEMVGAGLGSILANLAMVLAMIAIVLWRRPFRKYHIFSHFWRTDWGLFGRIFVVGGPIAVMYLMEYGVFATALLLMGLISQTAVAAHQVALQLASITFMIPFGISQAATVRVGHAVGRRDPAGARLSGWVAIGVGLVVGSLASLLFVAAPELLVSPWLDPAKPNTAATLALAAQLLLIAAAFQLADGAQAIGAGALRGLNDTAVPMVFTILAYWVVGFGLCWWLGFEQGLGPVGIWIGLAVGLAVAAVCHLTRFWWRTRRGSLPGSALAAVAPAA